MKIGGEIVLMIRFADDTSIVVIAESEGDILRAVEEMDEMLRKSEMKINSTKTKILARNPKLKADVYIGSQKLKQVEEMLYLGSKI
jgi:hypothetical protein